ncbi:MAG: hypothetical protein E7553_03875 [Ruminococcaceae bacterium]|nr:hypothetical protein [Oscillospiraceae bacterium]
MNRCPWCESEKTCFVRDRQRYVCMDCKREFGSEEAALEEEAANCSAEQARELGKLYVFHSGGDPEKKAYGLKRILEAHSKKDPEATYLVAFFLLNGVLTVAAENPEDHALSLMCNAANGGCIQARAYLNAYCERRYRRKYGTAFAAAHNGPLVDFEGKPVKVNRKGILTPIDAVLEYKDGRNVLTLSANVMFLCCEDIPHPEQFESAVLNGLRAWQGTYEVFGGQKVTVKVELTMNNNLYDNLIVIPMTSDIRLSVRSVNNAIGTKKQKELVSDMLTHRRSFAMSGLKWTVHSRKIIVVQSANGRFDDYDEIQHVAKHEFGHALGLGDLYASSVDSLKGVKKGTYAELDSYAIRDTLYNLVMCDHHGPISNNDIEMVILAFRENKMQLYQPGRIKGKLSTALGKGN